MATFIDKNSAMAFYNKYNLKTEGVLSLLGLATERVPPQEIPLHTILFLVFKMLIFRYFYCNFTTYSFVGIYLSNCT